MKSQIKRRFNKQISLFIGLLVILLLHSCVPVRELRDVNTDVPNQYVGMPADTPNIAKTSWRAYFSDPNLSALIDTALIHNQELNIMLLQIDMLHNEIYAKKGEYLPFVHLFAGAEGEKVGRYTRAGAVEENLEIKEGNKFPEPLGDFGLGIAASWEIDVWKKLRNGRKAAVKEYLASVEGKNFMVTNLVAEIADAYYELLAYDNQLAIINQNLEIQQNAYSIVKLQKQAAQTTELAVQRFRAELLKNKSERHVIEQKIIEAENKINFLIGQTGEKINRSSIQLIDFKLDTLNAGIPSQLLENRPDIKQAEYELAAAKLNTEIAKANFYPSFEIQAGFGLQAFNPKYLVAMPESILFSLIGDAVAPIINRNAIETEYANANDRQLQAIFEYEKTILSAYLEVSNQLSNIENLRKIYALREEQVEALTSSIDLSIRLFKSARADYMEVLLTQREALDSKMELVETKKDQMLATVYIYKALGGGWN